MKIIFSGGGTLGPVSPLLAVAEICRAHYRDLDLVWVGTKNGPEKELVEKYDIPFFTINAGKWRRYLSLWNIVDWFRIASAFFQSFLLLWSEKPDVVISAGGFVSVPLHWAAAFLGIPAWIHQQDARVGLANRLMAPFASKITVALEASRAGFRQRKRVEWLGNPVRDLRVPSKTAAKSFFGFSPEAPVIFVMGGGTGSAILNQMILEALPAWPKDWQIIHLTGRSREQELQIRATSVFKNYHVFPFFTDEMKYAFNAADLVVARAGFGTLTELASLARPVVLLPMKGHQEENALFLEQHKAAVVLNEKTDSGLKLARLAQDLIASPETLTALGARLLATLPPAPPEKVLAIVSALTTESK